VQCLDGPFPRYWTCAIKTAAASLCYQQKRTTQLTFGTIWNTNTSNKWSDEKRKLFDNCGVVDEQGFDLSVLKISTHILFVNLFQKGSYQSDAQPWMQWPCEDQIGSNRFCTTADLFGGSKYSFSPGVPFECFVVFAHKKCKLLVGLSGLLLCYKACKKHSENCCTKIIFESANELRVVSRLLYLWYMAKYF